MEDIMTDIRRAVIDEEAGAMVLPTAETKQATGRNPEAGLLSREATAAVGSAFSTLTETVKKHEPTLEDVVRETPPRGLTKICRAWSSRWCRRKSSV